ncbi:unnamed protein product [Lactuca saligna]|uniref:RanBP2-type domain-containing protein n=1 Tax=Lactuca saligna TaxID=75948 RepID=A0AA36EAQ9_LACSI|nr:unnamed protein product [Lactuca saligna]
MEKSRWKNKFEEELGRKCKGRRRRGSKQKASENNEVLCPNLLELRDLFACIYINPRPPPPPHRIQESLKRNTHFLPITRKMSRPGDWNCRSCQHLNFQRRDSCQRCGETRYGGGGGVFGGRGSIISPSAFGFTGPDVRPGDWYCNVGNCGAHNFASRSSCFKCGVSGLVEEVVVEAVAAAVQGGSPVTGYAAGLAAMNTTLQAEWNVLGATHLGNRVTSLLIKHVAAFPVPGIMDLLSTKQEER